MPMQWKKLGLIYPAHSTSPWQQHSALQPTPLLLDHRTIRVFAGFRDENGVSRVGYVDLDADDPTRIRKVSETPALDTGLRGMFDENGVVPCAIIRRGKELFL